MADINILEIMILTFFKDILSFSRCNFKIPGYFALFHNSRSFPGPRSSQIPGLFKACTNHASVFKKIQNISRNSLQHTSNFSQVLDEHSVNVGLISSPV